MLCRCNPGVLYDGNKDANQSKLMFKKAIEVDPKCDLVYSKYGLTLLSQFHSQQELNLEAKEQLGVITTRLLLLILQLLLLVLSTLLHLLQ